METMIFQKVCEKQRAYIKKYAGFDKFLNSQIQNYMNRLFITQQHKDYYKNLM